MPRHPVATDDIRARVMSRRWTHFDTLLLSILLWMLILYPVIERYARE